MKVAVIGAGIGGLTVTALLQEQGHDVKVFERKTDIKEVGADIGIGDNVLKKLSSHNLAKGIKNAGQSLKSLNTYSDRDGLLTSAKLKEGTLNVTLSRQSLIGLIYLYARPNIVFTDYKVTKVDIQSELPILHFSKYASQTFDLRIGADGIHSAVRKALFPGSKVIYQGYTCFRGMMDEVDIMNQYIADEYWGRRGRVGIMPLINSQAYWFITINVNEEDPKYVSFEKPHLQAYFNHYPNQVRALSDKQSETGIIKNDLYDLKPLTSFVYHRTVLLGDAAHAMTSNMGQGAGQTMEDAIVLANCIASYDLKKTLQRYNKLRVKRTKKVIKRSQKIEHIAQKDNKLVVALRNSIMRHMPKRFSSGQTKFLYKTKDK